MTDHREFATEQEPCYVTGAGRGQPRFDQEPVAEALVTDLDNRATSLFLDRLRLNNPHLFGAEDDQAILKMAGIIKVGSDGSQHPSLAGLLALGKYPQEFFPQLNLTD